MVRRTEMTCRDAVQGKRRNPNVLVGADFRGLLPGYGQSGSAG